MSLNMQPKQYSPVKPKQSSLIRSQANNDPLSNSTVKKMHPYSSNQQSPYTQSKLNYSLTQNGDELEYYKSKCYDLERDYSALRLDYEALKNNRLNNPQLDELCDQNNSLQAQLDRSNKSILQRKTEAEMWKQKYETQMGQLIQIKANYEMEIKSLSQELQRIQVRLNTTEQEKNRQISDQKQLVSQDAHSQLQTFKNSSDLQADMYESQIKKMRDIAEDKTVQAEQLQTKLERQRCEFNDREARLKNEIEALKNRISSIQIDHQAEQQALKNKLDMYKDTQFKNAQFAHENQADMLLSEIEELKHLMDVKNEEIESLISQNQKQKNAYDLDLDYLRFENEELKKQFLNNEQTHQQENHNIQSSLETMHNNQVSQLKKQNEQLIQTLNNENLKLKELIDGKNAEIEKQIIEKAQQKDYYDGEINRLVNNIEDHKRKYALLQAEKNREIQDLLDRIERLNEQNEQMRQDMQSQIDLLNQEINNLKDLINHKNEEIQQNLNNYSKQKLDLEDKIRQLNDEIDLLKLKNYELEKAKNQEICDLKLLIKEQEAGYKEKIKQLEMQIDHLKYELSKMNDMYNNKCRECENLAVQRANSEQQLRKTLEENDLLIQRLNAFEKEKNLEVDELRRKMDSGAAYQFENLKSAYNTQVGILSDQIADLTNQIRIKDGEIRELVEKYAILDKSVLPESLVQKNMYNSRTGVPAEYIVNKSVNTVLSRSQLKQSPLRNY